MTRTFTQTLESLGCKWALLDRRFSKSVAQVGAFSFRKLASAVWMPFRLLTMLNGFRPDVVVFFATNRTFSFLVDWALSELLRHFHARKILYLHTVGYQTIADRGPVWAWLVKRLLGSGDTVVTLGPSLVPDVARWVDKARIAFVPNTASEPPTEISGCDPGAPPLVLYLSNLIPEKGAGVFVDSALSLMGRLPAVRFILAGASADHAFTESLNAKVGSCADSRLMVAGAVTEFARKWELLSEASVLAFPSTYPFEAQPLTILEALSVGTPVVAFDVGGIRDVIRDGIDGCLVPAGDRAAFEAALLRFSIDRRDAEHTRETVRAGYEERFSRAAYTQNWAQVLRLVEV